MEVVRHKYPGEKREISARLIESETVDEDLTNLVTREDRDEPYNGRGDEVNFTDGVVCIPIAASHSLSRFIPSGRDS
jgi:hypothetical protein